MKLLISPTYLSKRLRNWNNNTIRIIERVCHKWDDMPSFFSLFQPLLSANSATSFCKLSHFILQTNPSHSAYEFESSSQRSHIFKPAQSNLQANAIESSSQRNRIFKPAQSNLQASAVGSLNQRSRMYRLNETYELAQ